MRKIKGKDLKGKNKSMILAERFRSKYKTRYISGHLRYYVNKLGYYQILTKDQCENLVYRFVKREAPYAFSASDIKQVYKILQMDIQSDKNWKPPEPYLLNCTNCVWDIRNNQYYKHSPKFAFTYVINAKCNTKKGRDDKLWKKFISDFTCNDKQLENLLQEWVGYLISGLTNEKKFAILYGPSDSGKSVFLRMISLLIGEEALSHVNIDQINKEFYLETMCQSRINICSDASGCIIKELSIIKQITSEQDAIMIRKPFCSPISITEKPKLMFATNKLPQVASSREDLAAYFNRVLLLPCRHVVKKPDRHLTQKLSENKGAILEWAAEGLKRYLEQGEFSKCNAAEEELAHYRLRYNVAQEFFVDRLKLKKNKKIFTADLEKALKKYVTSHELIYVPDYMNQLRSLLKERGVENKKIRIGKDNKPKQGFVGVKLRKWQNTGT